jgi:hypothetical protein
MVKLSLNETARRHDISKAGLSHAVHADRPIKGMSLHRFAVVEDGEIQGFEFPDWYSIPEENDGEEEQTVYMTMAELCREHSAFHRGRVEHALRKEWPIDGFPVYEWVVLNEEGEWDGFEVPKSADLDGDHRSNEPSVEESLQEAKKDGLQEGRPDEATLRNDGNSSGEEEEPRTDSKVKQAALAVGGAAVLKSILG